MDWQMGFFGRLAGRTERMSPLLILITGVVVVIGLIIVLRVHAFIALITTAILVSLLAPGELSEKISRVATAFGSTVGSIGIVIALAAVIGTCLMESGAADRIVRAFLRVLGEKRSSWALMGSGFVLSIPVFFDTVFYLLIPLARSLHKRTHKNYMLYLMAICAGGCITHTLVPPTPGPLFIAAMFKIDLGVMILVGTMIALPTAIVALMVCGLINRFVDIPMRSYSDGPEPDPIADEQLPPLWLSLLPVLLPVILISSHTVANVFAKAELVDLLTTVLKESAVVTTENAKAMAQDLVTSDLVSPTDDTVGLAKQLVESKITSTAQAADQLAQDLIRTNVLSAVEAAPRPAQDRANVTAVLGSPNLALLLSAVIAMGMMVWKQKLPLKALTEKVDKSLMSGGVIILITAGGGAFGAMLREAGIQTMIEETFSGSSQNAGMMIFFMAFGVSAMLKFAQGSSTVAMITTSSMFAAMGITSQMLGCNLVYLATAIGGGALVGSWMNDSGFWIVSRMGVLTETEALKSWTVLLATLGITAFGFTLLFSRVFPMI
jgi:gluconate:H+ symporter, GntP family